MIPKYRISLKPINISPGEKGWDSMQLVKILKTISSFHKVNAWYVSHVRYIGKTFDIFKEFPSDESAKAKLITPESRLISWIEETEYFESGVFLGTKEARSIEVEHAEGFWTEDEEWRDILDAVIEIRAFDTSYYEIYSSDLELLKSIIAKLPATKVAVETNPNFSINMN